MKWLHQKIPDELHQKLKVQAAEQQVSIRGLISKILTDWFQAKVDEAARIEQEQV